MLIAVLADIHGNLDALEAVLADLRERRPDRILVLGDHASGPLEPADTIDRLMALEGDVRFLRGNHDRWLVEKKPDGMGPSDAYAFARLSKAHLDWLRALPSTLAFDDVFACHGTPVDDTTYWLEDVADDGSVHSRPRSDIERLAAQAIGHDNGIAPNLLLCGHSHIPRAIALSDGPLIVNPGSVGLPGYEDDAPIPHVMQSGVPLASYALVGRRDSNAKKARWSVTFRLVPYDSEPMARLADRNGRAEWARAIRTGWIDP